MSREFPIPPGYISFAELQRRAGYIWRDEARARLTGLLSLGELDAFYVDRNAEVRRIAADFWKTGQARFAFDNEEIRRDGNIRSPRQSLGRPTVLKRDLDSKIPHPWTQENLTRPDTDAIPDPIARQAKPVTALAGPGENKQSAPSNARRKGRKPHPDLTNSGSRFAVSSTMPKSGAARPV